MALNPLGSVVEFHSSIGIDLYLHWFKKELSEMVGDTQMHLRPIHAVG